MKLSNQVKLIKLPEMRLIGLSVTSPFHGHRPERMEEMKREFHSRRHDVHQVVHPERWICASFSSEVMFTYLICMEVPDFTHIPEGMIGFTVPTHAYAAVKSNGDPYQVIHEYLRASGIQNHGRALALEIYPLDNPVWPDEAEVYVPVTK